MVKKTPWFDGLTWMNKVKLLRAVAADRRREANTNRLAGWIGLALVQETQARELEERASAIERGTDR